nr:MAG TPA: hypothetical protein [Bacteriophage sp.]
MIQYSSIKRFASLPSIKKLVATIIKRLSLYKECSCKVHYIFSVETS